MTIAIGLSPNTDLKYVFKAIIVLLTPWKWKIGASLKYVENWFKDYFHIKKIYFFNSGRSALLSILKAYEIGKGDEVIIQAFTCVAVPNCIKWVGAIPKYIDIDQSLNINSSLIEKSINKNTRAIIVQHTFGIPADIITIKKIAHKHNLILIEDCAHSIGSKIYDKKIGTFGDVCFFSFGRDKVISSVFGGAVILNNNNRKLIERLDNIYINLSYPDNFWILQQILHPIVITLILPIYNFLIGKFLIFFLQKISILSVPVSKIEKQGFKPTNYPQKYPNALAILLYLQLEKLEQNNKKRINHAYYYYQKLSIYPNLKLPPKINGAIYLRFNILTDNAKTILYIGKKNGIYLGNWYKNIIDPKGVDFYQINYQNTSCPHAEKSAWESVNLPTIPKLSYHDLDRVISLVNYANKNDKRL